MDDFRDGRFSIERLDLEDKMERARALWGLARIEDEREVVLRFLGLCSQFWKSPFVKQWTEEIEAGEIPDFGANLYY